MERAEALRRLVLVLWDKAKGHPDYVKAEWDALQRGIDDLMQDAITRPVLPQPPTT